MKLQLLKMLLLGVNLLANYATAGNEGALKKLLATMRVSYAVAGNKNFFW